MADDDPVWGNRAASSDAPANLPVRAASFGDPARIPPRRWLYGVDILRGHVTVIVAPGGVGKTSLAWAWALEIASGGIDVRATDAGRIVHRGFLGERVWVQMPTLICSLEDPPEETDRRLAALRLRHRIDAEALDNMVFTYHGDERRLLVAKKDFDGTSVVFPDVDAMIEVIRDLGIGATFVDPVINSHAVDENSNDQINEVALAYKRIARATDSAVILVHHTRKGALAGDIEGGRGAKALTDAARIGLTLAAMNDDEAKGFGIAESRRRSYLRLDPAKLNLSPAEKARWFELVSVELSNADETYESGDRVQAITRWTPPDVWGAATIAQLNAVLDVIERGLDDGGRFAPDRRSKERWAGAVLVEHLGITDEQAVKMLHAWVASGLLVVAKYYDAKRRQELNGLTVDNRKRPTE